MDADLKRNTARCIKSLESHLEVIQRLLKAAEAGDPRATELLTDEVDQMMEAFEIQ